MSQTAGAALKCFMLRKLLVSCLIWGAFCSAVLSPAARAQEPSNPVSVSTAMTENLLLAELEKLVQDLEMPSETDAPFRVFALEIEDFTPEKLPELLGLKHSEPLEEREIADFFEAAATSEEWMDDAEKARADRFAQLRNWLEENLEEGRVYVFGETEMDAVILGKTAKGVLGAVTLVVET